MCYTYDSLGRVLSRTVKDADDTVLREERFTYDAAGNLLGEPGRCNVYDRSNRLISHEGEAVVYDLDGNLLSDGKNAYEFDAQNRLISAGGYYNASHPLDYQ